MQPLFQATKSSTEILNPAILVCFPYIESEGNGSSGTVSYIKLSTLKLEWESLIEMRRTWWMLLGSVIDMRLYLYSLFLFFFAITDNDPRYIKKLNLLGMIQTIFQIFSLSTGRWNSDAKSSISNRSLPSCITAFIMQKKFPIVEQVTCNNIFDFCQHSLFHRWQVIVISQ